jgi:nitroimidazol reductase NimA-like FMN-containing flavoprotein (pyridoxamine 5'-phosphate oxidase superfamily)
MQLPSATIESLLETWPVARLATLTPEGRPHQVPIVFARVHDLPVLLAFSPQRIVSWCASRAAIPVC